MPQGFVLLTKEPDALKLKQFNDMTQAMYKKVYGGISTKDIDLAGITLPFSSLAGGTLKVGGSTTDGSLLSLLRGSTQIARLDRDGIWVQGQYLTIKHPYSPNDLSPMYLHEGRNFCLDHSFEMVAHGSSEDTTHHDFTFTAPSSGVHKWEIDAGAPKVFDDYGASYTNLVFALFGGQAAVVNQDNRLKYTCPIDGSRSDYTVSWHAWPHPTRGVSSMQSRVGVQYLNSTSTVIGSETLDTVTHTSSWAALTGDGRIANVFRKSVHLVRPSGARFICVRLMSANSGWICYDGIQITPFDKMCIYNPEDGAFKYLRG